MIAWLDIETTGLDPKVGSILELAFVLTDDELTEFARTSWLVRPLHLRGLEVMDDYVKKMHAKSGLMHEIFGADEPRGTPTCAPGVESLGRIELAAIAWLQKMVNDRAPAVVMGVDKTLRVTPLGGNSVHFDRAWIREHMPALEAVFSHRNIDCSTLNELTKRWAPELHEKRPGAASEPVHRAMADVEGSIALAQYYKRVWFTPVFRIDEKPMPEASAR